nr:PREDICTED: ATM interactor-like [Bemisia tabaci]
MSQTIFVCGDLTILKIFPSEADLCDIKTNIPCPVDHCPRIFKSSSNLTMHLEKYHKLIEPNRSSLEKKSDNVIYQYYCPVKFCQYHDNIKSNKKKIFFDQLKYLKQHFLKVHSEKRFTCSRCDKSFSIEAALKRHLGECGIEFKCSCGQSYSSRHNLLLHATRKNHSVDDKYRRLKMAKTSFMCILPKPSIPVCTEEGLQISISPQFSPEPKTIFKNRENLQLLTGLSKKKRITAAPRAKTDLGSLVKRNIVLKKLMEVKETTSKPSDFSTIFQSKNNLTEVFDLGNTTLLENDNPVRGFGPDSNFHITKNPIKTFESALNSSDESKLIVKIECNEPANSSCPEWSGPGEKSRDSEPLLGFPQTDMNLNELNSFSSKRNSDIRSVFDGCELPTSPKLSQSTQTMEPFASNFAFTRTGCDVIFDDGSSCNYYDSFEFSNSPKLSQSTQTFHSSSQLSQTDIQSSFFDDSSNNLSDLISYYDNFETSNSPKLSQSTQTTGLSLCSWSDNITQTDLEDQLFGDSPIAQLDECYRINYETSNCKQLREEDVGTQTVFLPYQDIRNNKSLLDELTTSETQTDPFENPYQVTALWSQSFSSTQTQTSTSFNYLIDSETQTQKLLNRLIDIETQTHVSNFC